MNDNTIRAAALRGSPDSFIGSFRIFIPAGMSIGGTAAAFKAAVNIVGDKARVQLALLAHRAVFLSVHRKNLGKDKFNTPYSHIAAVRAEVRGYQKSFHSASVFYAVVHLGEYHGKCYPLSGADILQRYVKLKYAPE